MARTVKVGLDVDEQPYVRGVQRAERATERLDDAVGDLGASAKTTTAGMGKARDTIGDAGVKARSTARDFDKLGKEAARAGRAGFRGFADAVESLPQQLRGSLIVGLGGAAVASAPLIGAALTGAIVGAVGSGAIAAGIAGAAKSSEVQAAWRLLAAEGKAVFADFSRPFVQPTVESITILRGLLANVRGDLDAIAEDASGFVGPLTRGLSGFSQRAVRGLRDLIDQADPIFEMFEDELPKLGKSVRTFFQSLGNGAEGGADALRALLRLVEAALPLIGAQFEIWAKDIELVANASQKFAIFAGPLAALFEQTGKKAEKGADGLDPFNTGLDETADSARLAADHVGDLNERFDDLFDKQMNLDQANVNFQLGLVELGETLKNNNETIDDANERWLRNQDALLGMVDEAKDARDAAIAIGNGTKEASDKANAAYDAQLEQIRKVATAMGVPIEKINELVNAWKAAHFEPKTARLVIIEDRQGMVAGGPKGALIAQAKGGIVAAQHGLITDSPMVLFGERQTVREAFIPQEGITRQRGIALGSEAMRWHGATVIPNEQLAALAGPDVVNVTVDLGHGIKQVFAINLREHDRKLRQRVRAGAGVPV